MTAALGWSTVIGEIEERSPFLKSLAVSTEANPEPTSLIGFHKILFRMAEQVAAEAKFSRLAVVVPKRHDLAMWAAMLYALKRIKADFLALIQNLPPLESGQKMLLDGRWVVEFDKAEGTGDRKLLWFWMGGDRARQGFRERDRLRFQPTTSTRRLTRVGKKETCEAAPPSLLDDLLDIQSHGNRAIFNSRVVLVSTIAKVKGLATSISMAPPTGKSGPGTTLKDLFQWAQLAEDGTFSRWGQNVVPADPVLTVAPNLDTALEFMASPQGKSVSLLVLDGAAAFSLEPHLLDGVGKTPVLAVADFGDMESMKPLTDRGFGQAVWIPKEVDDSLVTSAGKSPSLLSAFSITSRLLTNYGKFVLREHECRDEGLSDLFERLGGLEKLLRRQQSIFLEEVGRFYECLLMAARLVHIPPGDPRPGSWTERLTKRLEALESEVSKNRTWLTKEAHDIARGFIEELRSRLPALVGGQNGKIEALGELLEEACSADKKVALVLASPDDVKPTEEFWKGRLAERSAMPLICTPSTIDPDQNYHSLMVAGWLNWGRMSDLWDANLAPVQHLLLYPFELPWFQSARERWERERQPKTNRISKVSVLGAVAHAAEETAKYTEPRRPDQGKDKVEFDIAEFEYRLRAFRRHALVRDAAAHEKNVEARYVEFSEGYYSFLTEGHRLRVVTDHIAGRAKSDSEIPSKAVAELRVGDFVIFREGGAGDVIRAMADRALAGSGLQNLRQTARLWKDALAAKSRELRRGAAELVEWLRLQGCGRTESTIRRWIREDPDDYQIGPGAEEDLRYIVLATKHPLLLAKQQEVWRAIERVRSAHLQASGHLAELLLKQIPKHLGRVSGGAFAVEVEGVGKAWVLQIEAISTAADTVATSKANRLLRGE